MPIDYIAEFNLDIDQYEYPDLKPLDQDWRWCHKYAYDILKGNIPSCKKMKQVALRHFRDLQRDDIYFDEEAAASIVLWFKFCPIIKGANVGKSTILDPSQIFIVCSAIAWKWSSDVFEVDPETGQEIQIKWKGKRRYNHLYAQVSRKYGKTTLLAGMQLYLMYKYPFGPRVFSLATKKDQAKEVWKVAKAMIRLSPRLSRIFDPRANTILLPKTDGEFLPLASDSNSLDGLDPIAACLDECHAIKDRNLYGVINSAFGSNEGGEYLFAVITTAGFILVGLCTDLYQNGARVLDPYSDVEQDNYLYVIFEIDLEGDNGEKVDDWCDEQVWYKSNPGLVYGRPSLQYIRDQHKEALLSPAEKANFLTKHCNIFVSGVDKWLNIDSFRKCAIDVDLSDYENRECWIGFDRSLVSDITSASVIFADTDGGCTALVFNLQAENAVKNAPDILRGVYEKALDEDDLEIIPGEHIRNEHVKQMLRDLNQMFPKNNGFYYDPFKMKQVALDLIDEGLTMVSVSMGPGNISEPAKLLEMLINDKIFRYARSILLEYAAINALLSVSRYNNCLVYRDPNKVDVEKIDPLIATLLGLSGATLQKIEKNVYDGRGMQSL